MLYAFIRHIQFILDLQTFMSEFESHWVHHSFGFVPHRSKELRKLLCILIKLVTVVKGDLKAAFSIGTTRSVGESATPFPGSFHFTTDTYLIISVKQGSIKYHFLSFKYDTLRTRPVGRIHADQDTLTE